MRLVWIVVLGLLAVSLFGLATQPVSADDPPIQISTEVSPEEPLVDENANIEVTITNVRGSESRSVEIRTVYLREPGTANTYDRFSNVGTVASGDSITLPLSVAFDSAGQHAVELRVTAQYTDSDGSTTRYTHPIFVDVTETDLRGDVQLTGTEVSGGNEVTIWGDAANVGGSTVESVLVRVAETDSVSPSAPDGEYFVGSIDASEFSTFELTADIDQSTDSVPVEMTYIVTDEERSDERVTKTQQIPVSDSTPTQHAEDIQTAPADETSDSGLPLIPIGVVVALIVFDIAVLVFWRRRR